MLFVYHLVGCTVYCVSDVTRANLTWPAWSPGYNVVVSQWPPAEIKIKMGRSGYTGYTASQLTSLLSPLSTDHITVTLEQTATQHHSFLPGAWLGYFVTTLGPPPLFIQSRAQKPLMRVFATITWWRISVTNSQVFLFIWSWSQDRLGWLLYSVREPSLSVSLAVEEAGGSAPGWGDI